MKHKGIDINKLYVTFLSAEPAESTFTQEKDIHGRRDEFVIACQEIYLHCPKGYGRTNFSNNYFEKKLGIKATTRNWKTVIHLADIANY